MEVRFGPVRCDLTLPQLLFVLISLQWCVCVCVSVRAYACVCACACVCVCARAPGLELVIIGDVFSVCFCGAAAVNIAVTEERAFNEECAINPLKIPIVWPNEN